MVSKKISIIIPSYNSNDLLTRTLLSLKDIDFNLSEIIIIDDGSTIDQKQFIPKEIKKYKLIHQSNSGLSIARKNGVKIAKHDYIVFIDSDDYIIIDEYKKLEKIMKTIDDDIDLIRVGIIKANYKNKKNINLAYNSIQIFNHINKYLWEVFLKKRYTSITSVTHIYKREKILNINFSDKNIYSEDLEHFSRITESIKKILVTNISYYYHDNNRKESITNSKQKEMFRDQREIYQYVTSNVNNKYLRLIFSIFYLFYFKKNSKLKVKGYYNIFLVSALFCFFKHGK